jgi:adenylate cyclase
VRKAGGRVRITAQLIDGRTGGHVWADRYDRDLTDIFAIQDEISKAIVGALKIKLLPEEKRAIEQRGTTNVEAHDLYLMARQYWISGNWGDTRQLELVSRICQRAVEVDPNYARAWGLLAIVQCILHFTFMASDDDGGAAADRALSLDPKIAEGHIVHARHLYEQAKMADCDRAIAEALKADHESWEVNREVGRIYYFQRRFAEAIRHYERAVAIVDTDYHSWGLLSSCYMAVGDESRARHAADMSVTHAQQVLANDPTNGAALGMVGYGIAVGGDRERFKEWIDRAVLICPDNLIMRFNFACVMALDMKDAEAAIDILEPIVPDFSLSAFKEILADPDLDSLRGHPRFIRLIEETAKRLGVATAIPVAAAAEPLRS